MPRGVSGKREREYKELVSKFKKNDRYKGREEEVASRIVNKQRAKQNETKAAKSETKTGSKQQSRKQAAKKAGLPIKNYPDLTARELRPKLRELSDSDLKEVRQFERSHKNRKTVLQEVSRQLH